MQILDQNKLIAAIFILINKFRFRCMTSSDKNTWFLRSKLWEIKELDLQACKKSENRWFTKGFNSSKLYILSHFNQVF
jgi:hypothetical protein